MPDITIDKKYHQYHRRSRATRARTIKHNRNARSLIYSIWHTLFVISTASAIVWSTKARADNDRPIYVPLEAGVIIPIYPELIGGHDHAWNDVFQEPGERGGNETEGYWCGGDGAFSVELTPVIDVHGAVLKRTLWLFGDSTLRDSIEPADYYPENPRSVFGHTMAVQYQNFMYGDQVPGEIGYRDWGAEWPVGISEDLRVAADSWIPLQVHPFSQNVEGLENAPRLLEAIQLYFTDPKPEHKLVMWGNQMTIIGNDLLLFFTPMQLVEAWGWKSNEQVAVVVEGVDAPEIFEWGHYTQFGARWSPNPRQVVVAPHRFQNNENNTTEQTWGLSFFVDGDTVYIYGREKYTPPDLSMCDPNTWEGVRNGIIVARVRNVESAHDVLDFSCDYDNSFCDCFSEPSCFGGWEFYDSESNTWSPYSYDATPILNGGGLEGFYVMRDFGKLDDEFVMVGNYGLTHDIVIKTASSPTGGSDGWKDKYEFHTHDCLKNTELEDLVDRPLTGEPWPWFTNHNYNVIPHPEHSNEDNLLISYITSHSHNFECGTQCAEYNEETCMYEYIASRNGQKCCKCRADGQPCNSGLVCADGVCVEKERLPYYYYVPRFFRIPWADVRDFTESNKVRCDKWQIP